MALVLVTAPTVEPLDLATQVKPHLRVDIADDDTLIAGYLTAARVHVEQAVCRRALITQTFDLYLDGWPKGDFLQLPRPPLQSVTGVYYTPDGGSEQTFASSNYVVDTASEPGRVVLASSASWPGGTLKPANGVRVRFVAGYGAAGTAVPGPIKSAILLMVGDLYENREDTIIASGITIGKLPRGVEMLLMPYRVLSF